MAAERRQFAVKLQQVTGPVAAKGVEDTAFYRYYPLASLNEVGGDLAAKPISTEEFHRWMRQRLADWPHSLSATATHDSKRGEDFRARLNVLSEIPRQWIDAFDRWQEMNSGSQREIDGEMAPDANEQYLLYQTLVGTWPVEPMSTADRERYCHRIVQYMHKALREAKIHISWINPSEAYEAAARDFVRDLLGQNGAPFQAELSQFVRNIAGSGFVNSLAQVLLKLTVPGVPDFYQGSELWDFNLVDPDNRRPVDFAQRRDRLDKLLDDAKAGIEPAALAVAARWPDADVKLWVIMRCLALRRNWPNVFSFGDYVPLTASGPAADHVVSFARRFERQCVVVVAPRQYHSLRSTHGLAGQGVPAADWKSTKLILPEEWGTPWQDQLSGRQWEPEAYSGNSEGNSLLDIGQLLSILPVALLSRELGAGSLEQDA
jgi:(1->4)-alpha-D-glucan 1-alpha-D-glucosylmutase